MRDNALHPLPGIVITGAGCNGGETDVRDRLQAKISFQRPFSKPIEAEEEYDIVRQFESDRGRIVNSAAIRRLQQKPVCFRWSATRRYAAA